MKNQPAFPCQYEEHLPTWNGMTLRDYFAAKAMEAVIINSDRHSTSIDEVDQWVGNYAYTVADAMLRARDKA